MMEGCMVLDFYYFSYQCPLNDNMIRLLNEYRDKIDINLYDISNNHLLAGEMKIILLFCVKPMWTVQPLSLPLSDKKILRPQQKNLFQIFEEHNRHP